MTTASAMEAFALLMAEIESMSKGPEALRSLQDEGLRKQVALLIIAGNQKNTFDFRIKVIDQSPEAFFSSSMNALFAKVDGRIKFHKYRREGPGVQKMGVTIFPDAFSLEQVRAFLENKEARPCDIVEFVSFAASNAFDSIGAEGSRIITPDLNTFPGSNLIPSMSVTRDRAKTWSRRLKVVGVPPCGKFESNTFVLYAYKENHDNAAAA